MSDNAGVTSWGVAITLIVFLIIVDTANVAYVTQGSSTFSTNSTEFNSSSTATYSTTGVNFVNQVGHTQVSHDLPPWIQIPIFVINALVLVIVYMLVRGIW